MQIVEATPEALTVGMGELKCGRSPQTINCVLGSCIAAVIYHPRAPFAALAHIMLPSAEGRSGPPGKFADVAVPNIVQCLVRAGVPRVGLLCKIAGGSQMFGATGPLQIGESNLVATREALAGARVQLIAEHCGGTQGRRVSFDLTTHALSIAIQGHPETAI